MILTFDLPPGVRNLGTDLQSAGRWNDASLVRWIGGTMRPVGGWTEHEQVAGIFRGCHAWSDNSGGTWFAAGTADTLHRFDANLSEIDITPASLSSGNASGSTTAPATTWAMDNWGELLIACSSTDGDILEWTPGTTTPAQRVTSSPKRCLGALVSDERFLFAFGAEGDPRMVMWSNQEDRRKWTPSATNQAGDFSLATTGSFRTAKKMKGEILILTDVDAHTAQYVGPPFVYSFDRVGESCGAISQQALATVDQGAFWMGKRQFFRYSGGVVEPIDCEVWDAVYSNLPAGRESEVFATANAQYNEIWWFYPNDSVAGGVSYVSFNYVEGHWMTGVLPRTTGVDHGVFPYPLWCGPRREGGGHSVFRHETGFSYPIAVLGDGAAYAVTGPLLLGDGEQIMTSKKFIPDERSAGEVETTFLTRYHPNDTERSYGPFLSGTPTSVRFSGRQFRIKIDAVPDKDWRWGVPRLEVAQRGTR